MTDEFLKKESLTKTVTVGTALYSVQVILEKMISFFTMIILVRFLNIYDYGLLVLARSAFDTFNGFTNIGISSTVLADMNVERSRGNIGKFKAIFLDYVTLKCLIALVMWTIIFFGLSIFGNYYQNDVIPHVKLFSFLLLINPIRTIFSNILNTHLKFTNLALWELFESFIYLLSLVVLYANSVLTIKYIILATIFSQLFALVIFLPVFWKTYRYLSKVSRTSGNQLVGIIRAHGKWGIIENYIAGVSKNIRPWIVGFFLGVESVAIYSIAQSLVGHLSSVLPIQKVLAPIFPLNYGDKKKIAGLFFRSIKYSFYIMIAVILVGYIITPFFISLFFPKYMVSIPLFNIMATVLVLVAVSSLLNPLFDTFKLQKSFFYLTLTKLSLMVVIAVPLTYFFGLTGMALEFVITTFIFVWLRYSRLVKLVPELKVNFFAILKYDETDSIFLKKIFYWFKSMVFKYL